MEPSSSDIWSDSDVIDGVGTITGEELEVSDSLSGTGGGCGGISWTDSVSFELLMEFGRGQN